MENELARTQWRFSDGDTANWIIVTVFGWRYGLTRPNYRFSDGETTELNIVYDCGTYGLWSLLFWTNHLYYVFLLSIPGMVLPPGYSLWFFFYKPFMWCRSDARLRHGYSCIFLSRSHSDTRLALSILLWDFGRTTARLLFCFPCIIISMSDCTC